MLLIKVTLLSLIGGLFSNCFAEEHWEESLHLNGFITQGYIKTSDNNFFGDSPNGSFEFSEVGINASVKASTPLLLSGQILMRNAGEMYDPDPVIDYALADYTLLNTSKILMSLSVGRSKNPIGFYNDTRDVAFTRPSTFLPQIIYYDQIRNAFLSNDGLLFNFNANSDIGNIKLQIGYGQLLDDINVEIVYLGHDWEGSISNNEAKVARVLFESHDLNFRMALTALSFNLDFHAGESDPITNGIVAISYYVASLEYDSKDWWVTMEYAQEPIKYNDFGPIIPDTKLTVEGYYLQANYRLLPNASVHLRYERGYLDNKDKYGKKAEKNTGVPGYIHYAIGWSAGIRWDINKNWLMMLDYQKVEGALYLSPADNVNKLNLEKNWNMFNLLVSYRF